MQEDGAPIYLPTAPDDDVDLERLARRAPWSHGFTRPGPGVADRSHSRWQLDRSQALKQTRPIPGCTAA